MDDSCCATRGGNVVVGFDFVQVRLRSCSLDETQPETRVERKGKVAWLLEGGVDNTRDKSRWPNTACVRLATSTSQSKTPEYLFPRAGRDGVIVIDDGILFTRPSSVFCPLPIAHAYYVYPRRAFSGQSNKKSPSLCLCLLACLCLG